MAPNRLLALEDFVQRRLRHVEVAHLDDLREIAEEERQQQRADVTAVDVGVGHGHDLVVADLVDVEVIADARAHRGDEVANLFKGEHLVEPSLLDVEDFAAQRQDGLRLAVASALGGAARGIALDDVELAQCRVAL